jgi:23S rRNA pseudouridine2457 synthase
MLIAFHKPSGILSQFTREQPGQRTLAEFGFPRDVYPLGRLDETSEGLLLLTDEADLNQKLLEPREGHRRQYWAQVERVPAREDLARLKKGVALKDFTSRPCQAWVLTPQPNIAPRQPPIRYRKTVPTCWIALELVEGKNRQVRRMTAAIGHPTLRLIRVQIGRLGLTELPVGQWKILSAVERELVFSKGATPDPQRTAE